VALGVVGDHCASTVDQHPLPPVVGSDLAADHRNDHHGRGGTAAEIFRRALRRDAWPSRVLDE
jgi:hypothetical protein